MVILPLLIFTAVQVPGDPWLVGAWAPGPAQCAGDDGIRFENDGTYNDPQGEGLWELAGSRLVVSGTSGDDFGRSQVVRVGAPSATEMTIEWPDGARQTLHRCP